VAVDREIRLAGAQFGGLILATLALDGILHGLQLAAWGRWLGGVGLGLIVLSFAYSLRRRKWITLGKPVQHLRFHEGAAWLGSLLVLVHGGVHFNAILPWAAIAAMLVANASGLTGKVLLARATQALKDQREAMMGEGQPLDEIEQALLAQARRVDLMKQWRRLHFPITLSFAFLTLVHLGAIFRYLEW